MVCSEKRFHPSDFNSFCHNGIINNDLRCFWPVSYGKSGLTGLTVGEGGPFNSLALNSGDILSVDNTTTITAGGTLSMSGGALSTSTLFLDGGKFGAAASDFSDINTFQFNSGTLNVTGPSGLTVGTDGPLGGLVVIANNQELIVDNTTTIASGGSLSISGGH